MNFEEARAILGEDFEDLSDEAVKKIVTLATLVCEFVLSESSQDLSDQKDSS